MVKCGSTVEVACTESQRWCGRERTKTKREKRHRAQKERKSKQKREVKPLEGLPCSYRAASFAEAKFLFCPRAEASAFSSKECEPFFSSSVFFFFFLIFVVVALLFWV